MVRPIAGWFAAADALQAHPWALDDVSVVMGAADAADAQHGVRLVAAAGAPSDYGDALAVVLVGVFAIGSALMMWLTLRPVRV